MRTVRSRSRRLALLLGSGVKSGKEALKCFLMNVHKGDKKKLISLKFWRRLLQSRIDLSRWFAVGRYGDVNVRRRT